MPATTRRTPGCTYSPRELKQLNDDLKIFDGYWDAHRDVLRAMKAQWSSSDPLAEKRYQGAQKRLRIMERRHKRMEARRYRDSLAAQGLRLGRDGRTLVAVRGRVGS